MNLVGKELPVDQTIGAAYRAVGIPLWVRPNDAIHHLRNLRWSNQISIELGGWFARVWSMAFAAGFLGLRPFAPSRDHVLRLLSRMGYSQHRADELASLLLDDIDSLHRKGQHISKHER